MVALGSPPPTHDCQDEQGRASQNDDHPEPSDRLADRRTDPQEQKADRRRDHAPAQSCCEHAALEGGLRALLRSQELAGAVRLLNVHQ